MKAVKWTILISLNVFLGIFCFWVLLYLDTYINGFFIPDKFIWNNGVKRDKPLLMGVLESDLILFTEAALIFFIFYLLNRWLFIDLLAIDNSKLISKRIYVLSMITMLIVIIVISIQS